MPNLTDWGDHSEKVRCEVESDQRRSTACSDRIVSARVSVQENEREWEKSELDMDCIVVRDGEG